MRTYVRMIFNSEGASPDKIVAVMRELGFEESFGIHDFVYKWKNKVAIDEVLALITRMHQKLKGLIVSYEVITVI